MKSRRIAKINELIQQELNQLIQKEFSEKYGLISVLAVDISPDLAQAKVFISVFNTENQAKILAEIKNKAYQFQSIMARKLTIRTFPTLHFVMGQELEKEERINQLLDQI